MMMVVTFCNIQLSQARNPPCWMLEVIGFNPGKCLCPPWQVRESIFYGWAVYKLYRLSTDSIAGRTDSLNRIQFGYHSVLDFEI